MSTVVMKTIWRTSLNCSAVFHHTSSFRAIMDISISIVTVRTIAFSKVFYFCFDFLSIFLFFSILVALKTMLMIFFLFSSHRRQSTKHYEIETMGPIQCSYNKIHMEFIWCQGIYRFFGTDAQFWCKHPGNGCSMVDFPFFSKLFSIILNFFLFCFCLHFQPRSPVAFRGKLLKRYWDGANARNA